VIRSPNLLSLHFKNSFALSTTSEILFMRIHLLFFKQHSTISKCSFSSFRNLFLTYILFLEGKSYAINEKSVPKYSRPLKNFLVSSSLHFLVCYRLEKEEDVTFLLMDTFFAYSEIFTSSSLSTTPFFFNFCFNILSYLAFSSETDGIPPLVSDMIACNVRICC